MHHPLLTFAALVSCAVAQDVMGTFRNTGTTWTTRGFSIASENNPAVVFTRHDKECYAGWTTGAVPNTRDVVGINFVIQDENLATQDAFDLIAFTEDPAQPNFPDVVTPVGTALNFALPTGTGGGAFNGTVNFATPLLAPAGGDVFVGLRFNTPWVFSGQQITDGLSVWEIQTTLAAPQPGQAIDQAGAGLPPTPATDGRFSGIFVASPATGPTYTQVTQFKINPVTPVAGGVATARTNQTLHPASTATAAAGFTVQNPGAGTSCMFSGLYPDAASPSTNPGRADDIGQIYYKNGLTNGLVFFLIDFGGFGFELPMSGFLPGSTGVSCLNLGTLQTLAIGFVNNGAAFNVAAIPAASRPLLTGFSWLSQAVGVDLTTNVAHAGPCTRQLL